MRVGKCCDITFVHSSLEDALTDAKSLKKEFRPVYLMEEFTADVEVKFKEGKATAYSNFSSLPALDVRTEDREIEEITIFSNAIGRESFEIKIVPRVVIESTLAELPVTETRIRKIATLVWDVRVISKNFQLRESNQIEDVV